jgi:small subunit ribosomal protein S21
MSIRIKARAGESAEQLVRRFKKMCEKEGLTKDIKRRAYYEKPSERKQRTMRKSVKRTDGPTVAGRPRTPRKPAPLGKP